MGRSLDPHNPPHRFTPVFYTSYIGCLGYSVYGMFPPLHMYLPSHLLLLQPILSRSLSFLLVIFLIIQTSRNIQFLLSSCSLKVFIPMFIFSRYSLSRCYFQQGYCSEGHFVICQLIILPLCFDIIVQVASFSLYHLTFCSSRSCLGSRTSGFSSVFFHSVLKSTSFSLPFLFDTLYLKLHL